jgi:hypothetical protein
LTRPNALGPYKRPDEQVDRKIGKKSPLNPQ